jgi:polysaccharide deacetylase family protein (PEP-CTERM system associated)
MKNALTIDLEDYFHVTAFADRLRMNDWNSQVGRLHLTTEKILDQLASAGCHATFFVLGWVAEQQPALIARIADSGHEIGCHSYAHRLVYELTRDQFREDTLRAKQVIEDACGRAVRGYRAPSFSIRPEAVEVFEVLAELGFEYDSSIFPVEHPNYGAPQAPRFPFIIDTVNGHIVEFPMATIQFAGKRSPIGGGAYMRLLPYRYTRWALRFINEQEHHPFCVYFHPWELDPAQPKISGSITAKVRHYLGLHGMEMKLRQLLDDFDFCSLGEVVEHVQRACSVACSAT